MDYDKQDELLVRALEVVRTYDPALFARMDADALVLATDFPPWVSAYAATQSAGCDSSDARAHIALNAFAIMAWAFDNDVPAEMFAADVLAHEYAHAHQDCEPDSLRHEIPAFTAGSAFARKLPEPYGSRMAALSDETREDEEQSGTVTPT